MAMHAQPPQPQALRCPCIFQLTHHHPCSSSDTSVCLARLLTSLRFPNTLQLAAKHFCHRLRSSVFVVSRLRTRLEAKLALVAVPEPLTSFCSPALHSSSTNYLPHIPTLVTTTFASHNNSDCDCGTETDASIAPFYTHTHIPW